MEENLEHRSLEESAAIQLFKEGRFEDAQVAFDDLIKSRGETLLRVFYLARSVFEMGNVEYALAIFKIMREDNEGKLYAYIDLNIALCQYKLGNLAAAREEFVKLLDHAEFLGNVHLNLAKMAETEVIKKQYLLDGYTKHGNIECALMLGNYYREHDPENALRLARSYYEHLIANPSRFSGEAQFGLGALLFKYDPASLEKAISYISAAFIEEFPLALQLIENIQIHASTQVDQPSGTDYDSGLIYFHDKDLQKALKVLEASRIKKTPDVQFNLGLMKLNELKGNSLKPGMDYLQKAAKRGHEKAAAFMVTIRSYC